MRISSYSSRRLAERRSPSASDEQSSPSRSVSASRPRSTKPLLDRHFAAADRAAHRRGSMSPFRSPEPKPPHPRRKYMSIDENTSSCAFPSPSDHSPTAHSEFSSAPPSPRSPRSARQVTFPDALSGLDVRSFRSSRVNSTSSQSPTRGRRKSTGSATSERQLNSMPAAQHCTVDREYGTAKATADTSSYSGGAGGGGLRRYANADPAIPCGWGLAHKKWNDSSWTAAKIDFSAPRESTNTHPGTMIDYAKYRGYRGLSGKAINISRSTSPTRSPSRSMSPNRSMPPNRSPVRDSRGTSLVRSPVKGSPRTSPERQSPSPARTNPGRPANAKTSRQPGVSRQFVGLTREFDALDKRAVSAPSEELLRLHDIAMWAPDTFEEMYMEGGLAHEMTELSEARAFVRHADCGGVFVGESDVYRPREDKIWVGERAMQQARAKTNRAVSSFIEKQTPYQDRHLKMEGKSQCVIKDLWKHDRNEFLGGNQLDRAMEDNREYDRVSPDARPERKISVRKNCPFKQRNPKAKREEERQKIYVEALNAEYKETSEEEDGSPSRRSEDSRTGRMPRGTVAPESFLPPDLSSIDMNRKTGSMASAYTTKSTKSIVSRIGKSGSSSKHTRSMMRQQKVEELEAKKRKDLEEALEANDNRKRFCSPFKPKPRTKAAGKVRLDESQRAQLDLKEKIIKERRAKQAGKRYTVYNWNAAGIDAKLHADNHRSRNPVPAPNSDGRSFCWNDPEKPVPFFKGERNK